MDKREDHIPSILQSADLEGTSLCWKELLDHAFSGWAPTGQSLERLIDRAEENKR